MEDLKNSGLMEESHLLLREELLYAKDYYIVTS